MPRAPGPGGEEEEEDNPFVLPGDAEVFRLREEERKRKAIEREAQKSLPIWKKSVRTYDARARVQQMMEEAGLNVPTKGLSRKVRETRELVAEARALVANERRQEKESMAEFIAKKREMFLVQMSLDTKREEIRKLEAKAQAKEEALKKSEQMLEEDAIRFDTFLKENDKKAHEAIKKAERETKLKSEKVHEIKRLNQQIQLVTSEMSKHKEALEDCLKYKDFLDSLTPEEWFIQQRALKLDRQEARRVARVAHNAEKREAARREMQQLRAAHNDDDNADAATESCAGSVHGGSSSAGAPTRLGGSSAGAPPRPGGRSRNARGSSQSTTRGGSAQRARKASDQKPAGVSNKGAATPPVLLPPELLESEELESSGDELPMYFKQPQQLLDIFAQLEEQNLFLIQNSQETEQALEELKQNFEATKHEMDSKTELLQLNIDELEDHIAQEESKADQLRSRLGARAGETQNRQEALLAQLHDKVRDVYQKCGFDITSQPATLFMLSELEARLESLLDQIESMPEEYILKEEKDKEKKRRERKRAEQQALQDALQEERNRKSIERSLQAPKKRTGRPVMFRSPPIRKTVRHKKEDDDKEEEDDLKYLT